MEFLSQDREIGPELVILLTAKLKRRCIRQKRYVTAQIQQLSLSASIYDLFQENKRLQTQLDEIQKHVAAGPIPKLERDDEAGVAGYACREGICPVRWHPVCYKFRIDHSSVRQLTV